VFLLADERRTPLDFRHEGLLTTVSLPSRPPDGRVSVVALEYAERPAVVEGLVARTVDGGHSLQHGNRVSEEGQRSLVAAARGGTVPTHVAVEGDYTCRWKVFVDRPGRMRVDASYSAQGEGDLGALSVTAAGSSVTHAVRPTGQTVGEPNQAWHIDNFASRRVGVIDFLEPGVHEVALTVGAAQDHPVSFQWLWLQREDEPPAVSSEYSDHDTAIGRRDAIAPAFEALLGVVDEVYSIELPDVERARDLLLAATELPLGMGRS
jgi:hypothetical protein